ncbi:MAG TPA: hypothetical protein VJA63_01705 [Candidatus Paceibacterota bacterium]
MRELTDDERRSLNEGRCPFCGGNEFQEGPSGGAATNYRCANPNCHAKFNLMNFGVAAAMSAGPATLGQLLSPPEEH